MRRYFGAAGYGLVPPPEDVPPLSLSLGEVLSLSLGEALSLLLGEVTPPPPVTPPASAGLAPSVAGVDGVAVCVAGELVAGELSALRSVTVSPGTNLLPELRSSRDVCGVPFGASGDFVISGVGVEVGIGAGAGAGEGVSC
jgi:hypothetical protein